MTERKKSSRPRDPLWVARNSVGIREAGLRRMKERHARERMQKEQEMIAARALVEQLEQEYPEFA